MPNQLGIADHNGENAEKLAVGYKTINRRTILHPDVFKKLDEAAAQNESLRILDIGCGSGNDAFEMATLGHKVVGIDPSDLRLIAERDHKHPNIEYRGGLLPTLDTVKEDEKFDMVVMSAVWQYIDPAERVASLIRIANVMEPNGKLAISYLSPPSRAHQYEVSPEMFKADIEAANAALPNNKKLTISTDPVIKPDVRGRKSLDGRDMNLYNFIVETGHAKLLGAGGQQSRGLGS